MSFFVLWTYAQTFEVNGIAYNITSAVEPYTVEVTKKTPIYSGDIIIPESVMFESNNYIVNRIGFQAFINATNLTSLVMPNSIESLGSMAFVSCNILNNIVFSNSLRIIEGSCFFSCNSIQEFDLPNSLDSIGSRAFSSCSGITSFAIPTSVSTIADEAFMGCANLISITIPESVTSLGSSLFVRCFDLESINVDPNNQYYSSENGILFNKDKTTLMEYPSALTGTYVVPEYVRRIEDGAFCNRFDIVAIYLPDSLLFIGESAFAGCEQLEEISIPKLVEVIGLNAFTNIDSLNAINVDIENQFYSSDGGVLYNKTKSCLIQFPGGLANHVNVPESVNIIAENAFHSCQYITSITLPDNLSYIDSRAFGNCQSLVSVDFGNGLDSIRDYAFSSCKSLSSITLPNSLKSIGQGAFSSCGGLINVEFGNELEVIGLYAFMPDTLINQIIIPNSVKTIKFGAFLGCTNAKYIRIGSGVELLESQVFSQCTSIEYIVCCTVEVPESGCYLFYQIPYDIPLFVPSSSVADYEATIQWYNFNIIGVDDCDSFVTEINNQSKLAVSVYPNPFENSLILETEEGMVGQLEIFDSSGKLVIYRNIYELTEINTSELQTGIYFYCFVSGNKRNVGKLVKI